MKKNIADHLQPLNDKTKEKKLAYYQQPWWKGRTHVLDLDTPVPINIENVKDCKVTSTIIQSEKPFTVDDWTKMHEDAIANARRAAIREAMEVNNFSEEEILDVFEEIGLKDGGIASLKNGGMLDFGGREMDLRGGGFVPMGKAERADDVPARLSKNEFVMTADAVRAAGGGSVNKGAKRMYNLMNTLEARA